MSTQRGPRGQALTEFALVIPIFLLILFGVIELGRFVYTDSSLSQAAREGARLAAVEARWIGDTGLSCVPDSSGITAARPGAHVCPSSPAALKAHVVDAVNRMTIGLEPVTQVYVACTDQSAPAPAGEWTDGSVAFPNCGGVGAPNGTGDLVSVRVVYEYTPLIPLIGPSLRSASATMAVN